MVDRSIAGDGFGSAVAAGKLYQTKTGGFSFGPWAVESKDGTKLEPDCVASLLASREARNNSIEQRHKWCTNPAQVPAPGRQGAHHDAKQHRC